MSLQIIPVNTKKLLRKFIAFPFELHKHSSYWASLPQEELLKQLDPQKNPFFEHADFEAYLAVRNHEIVGRIAAILDHDFNSFHDAHVVHFGYLEMIDDLDVAKILIETVKAFAKKHDKHQLLGPINLSTNYECGLLVKGYEDTACIQLPYHPPYYATLLTQLGFSKAKDLLGFSLCKDTLQYSEKQLRVFERIRQRKAITFRPVDLKNFDQEIEIILDIYNDAWEKNWGFVPLNQKEFRFIAEGLKNIIDPHLGIIALMQGTPIGFALAIPDMNQVFRKLFKGKLFPFGFLKVLWHLHGPGKAINRVRFLTLGIKKDYQSLGLTPLIYKHWQEVCYARGYYEAEASWILENYTAITDYLYQMNAEQTKIFRIYETSV